MLFALLSASFFSNGFVARQCAGNMFCFVYILNGNCSAICKYVCATYAADTNCCCCFCLVCKMHFAISVNYLASVCPALPQSACLPCLVSSRLYSLLASSVSLAWGPLLMRRTPSCVSCDSRQISKTKTTTTTLETITQ